jgi:tetratricopeptide (TPR) repeat protein
MSFRMMLAAVLLVVLAGCGPLRIASRPEAAPPLQSIIKSDQPWSSQLELSADDQALAHFLKAEVALRNADYDIATSELEAAVQLDPSTAQLRRRLANLYVRRGQLDKAYQQATQAVEIEPGAVEGRLLLAGIVAALGRDQEAREIYTRIINDEPKTQEAYLYLAALHSKAGDNNQALAILEKLIQKNPNSVMGYYYLGRVHAAAGRLPEAERYFREALRRNPRSELVLTDLGLIQEMQHRPDEAAELYRKVIEVDPENAVARRRLASLLVGQKRLDEALGEFRELERVESDPVETRVKIGLIYFEKGDFERAATEFNLVLGSNPGNFRVRYYLGVVYAETRETQKAIEQLQQVPPGTDLYPDAQLQLASIAQKAGDLDRAVAYVHTALQARPDATYMLELLVSLERERKRIPDAIEIAQRLVATDPNNDRYVFILGALYDEAKDHEASLVEMRRAIEINPRNAAALNYLGYSLAESGNQLDEAEKLIRRAIAIDPTDGFYVDSLGWVYFQRGEFVRAVEELERAAELAGEDPTIIEHLADAYRKTGKEIDALRAYREALGRSKDPAQSARIKEKIQILERADKVVEQRL